MTIRVRSPRFTLERGFSLIEVIIGALFLSISIMGIIRLLSTNSLSVVQIHKDERKSALLDYIEARFKAADFYDVFGVDSARKGGSPRFAGTIGTANSFWGNTPQYMDFPNGGGQYGQYWTNWSTSRMKQVLLDIDARVAGEGYTRWVVRMTPAQRTTVSNRSTTSLAATADLRFYNDSSRTGIDNFNPSYRYADKDGDGLFFSTYTDAQGRVRSEIPNMPYKYMAILLYQGATLVNAKRPSNFLLTPGGLSGDEMGVASTTLWATIELPNWALWQDSPLTHPLVRFGLDGATFFKNTTFTRVIVNPRQVDLPNSALVPPNPGHRMSVNVKTTPGAVIHCVADGDATTETTALVGVTGIESFLPLDTDAITRKLMGEGGHSLRFYAERNGNQSPSITLGVGTDRTAPIAVTLRPVPGSVVHTRSPNVYAIVMDTMPASGTRFGVEINSISMAKTTVDNPVSLSQIDYRRFRLPAFEDPTIYFRSASYVNTNGLTALFVDTGTAWLPYVFEDGETVHMRVECADGVPHKSATQWSFTVSLPDVDTSTPTVTPISPLPASTATVLAPIVFRVSDPQSGVNPASVELVLNGTTVLSLSSGSRLGKSLSNYVDPTGATNTGGFLVTYVPTAPHLSGFNSLQVRIKDWKENANDTSDPSSQYFFFTP